MIDFLDYITYEIVGVLLGVSAIYLVLCGLTQKWWFVPQSVINKIVQILKSLPNNPIISSIVTFGVIIALIFAGCSLWGYQHAMNSPHKDVLQNITIQKTVLAGSILRPNSIPIVFTADGHAYGIVPGNESVYIQLQEGKSYEVMMSVPKLYGDERDLIREDNGTYIRYVVRQW